MNDAKIEMMAPPQDWKKAARSASPVKRLVRWLRWAVFNLAIFIPAYYWLAKGNELAGNYTVFMVYLHFVCSLVVFHKETVEKLKDKGCSVHPLFNLFIDFCFGLVLATLGHWWLAIVYILGGKFQQEIYT